MPRPDKPVADTEIRHDTYGQAVVGYAAEQMRFVRRTAGDRYIAENVSGSTTPVEAEITTMPSNNPKVKYAVLFGIVRSSASDNQNLELLGPDDAPAGLCYTSGVPDKGGNAGPFLVPVGGLNGRSIRWKTSSAGVKVWIGIVGWWELV